MSKFLIENCIHRLSVYQSVLKQGLYENMRTAC